MRPPDGSGRVTARGRADQLEHCRSRLGPHVRRSRRKGAPGARSEASTPGRVAMYNGGASRVRVTPAELVAVGDE
jgi:hypothetical protein